MKYRMRLMDINLPWTQAELARKLGVSRTHITLLVQGKRKLSRELADKLADALADKSNAHTVASNPLGGINSVFGGFDSHALPPVHVHVLSTKLLTDFINSRRQGLSPRSIDFYRCYLNLAIQVVGTHTSGHDIARFLSNLGCTNGGKHAYYRTLRVFYNWLYSPKSGYNLNPQDNPMLMVDAPKLEKKILPSLSVEQVEYLIKQAECIRDRAIISLFVDSGLRLTELANIVKGKTSDVDIHSGVRKLDG